MNPEEKFEKILDEAIALLQRDKTADEIIALYPAHAAELRDLLGVAATMVELKPMPEEKAVLSRILQRLPASSTSASSVAKISYNSFITSFMNNFRRCFKLKYVLASLALFIVGGYVVASFTINRLLEGTTGPTDVDIMSYNSLPTPVYNSKNSESQSGQSGTVSNRQLGLEYPEASGLSARDIRSSIPILGRFFQKATEATIDDTREFLKTGYNAILKTRRVEELAARAQTIVRGYGGRVDSVSVNTQYAYLSFVVPKDAFETFKREIRSLVPARFIAESIRMENLLPQKQNIEQQTDVVTTNLAELQKQRADLVVRHRQTVIAFNSQISALNRNIAALEAEASASTTPFDRGEEIDLRELPALRNRRSTIQQQLVAENTNYARELNMLDAQIKNSESGLTNLQAQDQNLLDNVATVEGTIAIEWISIPQIIALYVPHFWLWLILLGAAVLFYRSHRRKKAIEPV